MLGYISGTKFLHFYFISEKNFQSMHKFFIDKLWIAKGPSYFRKSHLKCLGMKNDPKFAQ